MKYIIIFLILLSLTCYGFTPSQQKLIDLSKKELIELNSTFIKNRKKLENLKNKDVYLKARLIDKENGKYKIVVADISLDSPDNRLETDSENANEYLYLKGKIIDDNNDEFKFDIEYVLPEANNSPKVDKNSNN